MFGFIPLLSPPSDRCFLVVLYHREVLAVGLLLRFGFGEVQYP